MKQRKVRLVISAVLAAVGIFGLLGGGILWCCQLSKLSTGAASIGIIGGVDGPTAIFVRAFHYRLPWYGFLILAVIGIAGLFWCIKKKKEE